MDKKDETLELLRSISSNQQKMLEGQSKAFELQKNQFELVKVQFERAEKLQDRAERMQETGASVLNVARRAILFILPIIIVLIIYLSWLMFR